MWLRPAPISRRKLICSINLALKSLCGISVFVSCTRLFTYILLSLLAVPAWAADANVELTFVKQNSKPKYFSIDQGRQGLCDQVYSVLSEHLVSHVYSVKINPLPNPIKRILSMLEVGKAQVFSRRWAQ